MATELTRASLPFGTLTRTDGKPVLIGYSALQRLPFRSQRQALIWMRENRRHIDLERPSWEALEARFSEALSQGGGACEFAGLYWVREHAGQDARAAA